MVFDLDLVGAVSGDIDRFCRDAMMVSRHAVAAPINELVETNGGILSHVLGNILSECFEIGALANSVFWLPSSSGMRLLPTPLPKRLASCSCGSGWPQERRRVLRECRASRLISRRREFDLLSPMRPSCYVLLELITDEGSVA